MTEFPTLLKEVCRYESDSDRMRYRISRTMRAPNHGFLFSRTHVRATRPCPRRARRRITFYLSTGYFFPAAAFFFFPQQLSFFLQSLLEQLLQPSHGFLFSHTHTSAHRARVRAEREGGFLFYLSTGYFSRGDFNFFPAHSSRPAWAQAQLTRQTLLTSSHWPTAAAGQCPQTPRAGAR